MTTDHPLQCVRCSTPLPVDGHLTCSGCGKTYKRLGGVAAVFADLEGVERKWRQWLGGYAAVATQRIEAIQLELRVVPGGPPATRLQATARGQAANTRAILGLAAQAGLAPDPPRGSMDTTMIGEPAIMSGFVQLLRDWSWDGAGSTENREALDQAVATWGDRPAPKRVLVLGAGGGRLAWDLHQRWRPDQTVALDVNPLPMLVMQQVVSGDMVPLVELVPYPRTPLEGTVIRELRTPAETAPGFTPVLADAFGGAVTPGHFDAVVTPWFIDACGKPVDQTIRQAIHPALAPGGAWLMVGPLLYQSTSLPLATRFTAEEATFIASKLGLQVGPVTSVMRDYLVRPTGSYGRRMLIHSWLAEKLNG